MHKDCYSSCEQLVSIRTGQCRDEPPSLVSSAGECQSTIAGPRRPKYNGWWKWDTCKVEGAPDGAELKSVLYRLCDWTKGVQGAALKDTRGI
jgi:hypothetical protein